MRPVVLERPTPGVSEIALLDAITRHRNGEIPVVDLSKATTFSWDRVYIFEPYTDFSDVSAVAGESWGDSCFTTIMWSEGISLLVFTKENRAVGCIEVPMEIGNFASLSSHKEGFVIEEARFMLDESGNMTWVGHQ